MNALRSALTDPDPRVWQRRLFTLFALVGWVLLWVIPPFFGNDEEDYVFRAWQVSQGQVIADHHADFSGGDIPKGLYDAWWSVGAPAAHDFYAKLDPDTVAYYYDAPLGADRPTPMDFRNTALYSPVGFLPHLPAMWLGEAFGLSPFELIHVARAFQYALWLLIMALALRRLPGGQFLWLLLLFMPMSLYQAVTVTVDGLNNALAFLLLASVLRWRRLRLSMTVRRILFLLVVLLAVVLIKQIYIILAGVMLLIPAAQWSSRGRQWGSLLGIGLMALLAGLWWSKLALTVYEPMMPLPGELPNPSAQIAWMKAHPWMYLKGLLVGIVEWSTVVWYTWIGILGKTSIELPWYVYGSVSTFLLVLLFLDRPILSLRLWQRVLMAGIFVAGLLAVFVVITISFKEPGDMSFHGVVGRYLIPFAPFLLFALQPRLPRLAAPAPSVADDGGAGVCVSTGFPDDALPVLWDRLFAVLIQIV